MTEFQHPTFDNPVSSILKTTLGVGNPIKSVSDYLWGIVGALKNNAGKLDVESIFTRPVGDIPSKGKSTRDFLKKPMRQFLSTMDPHGIVANRSRLKEIAINSMEYKELLRDIGVTGGAGSRLRNSFFAEIQKSYIANHGGDNPILLWDKAKRALFYGSTTTGFAPIPVAQPFHGGNFSALAEARINIGYNSYTSFGLTAMSSSSVTSLSPIEAIYLGLNREAAKYSSGASPIFRSLSRLRRTQLGLVNSSGKQLTVGQLLQPGEYIKGASSVFTQAAMGLKNVVGFQGSGVPLQRLISSRADASAAINIITRSGAVPHIGGLILNTKSQLQAFKQARQVLDSYSEKMLEQYKALGISEYYPYIKPEYIGGLSKNMVVPYVEGIRRVFGDPSITGGFAKKGLFQMFKVGPLSPSQLGRVGRGAFPTFATYEGLEDAVGSGITNMAFRGMPLTVGVMDFKNALSSRLFTQEGGAILTRSGAKKLAQRLPMGQVVLGASDIGKLKQIEELISAATGSSIGLLTEGKSVLNLGTNFTAQDVHIATLLSKKGNAVHAWKDLTDIQKSLRKVLLRGGKGKARRLHPYTGTLKAVAGHTLSTVETRGDSVVLSFMSKRDMVPGASELEIGGRRLTAVRVAKGHPMFNYTGDADVLVSRDEFLKMSQDNVFLNTFFSRARSAGKFDLVRSRISAIGETTVTGTTNVGQIGHSVPTFSLNNYKKVAAQARALVDEWSASGDPALMKLASSIYSGAGSGPSKALSQLGLRGISSFIITGGMRSDFMHDINVMRGQRLTPTKILSLVSGARLLGYSSPEDSPIAAPFLRMFNAKAGGEFGINYATGRVYAKESSALKAAMGHMLGMGLQAPTGDVVTIANGRFMRNGVPLEALPGLSSFTHQAGGVPFSQLKGTMLAKSRKITYIDLGKRVPISLGGKAPRMVRYLPISTDILRLNKGVGGRLVVGGNHPGYNLVRLLHQLEAGISPSELEGSISAYSRSLLGSMSRQVKGTRGALEHSMTVNVRSSIGVRLAPQRSMEFTHENFLDSKHAFDVYIGESELDDFFRRRTSMVPEEINVLKKRLKDRGYLYTMIAADPTQRPEHQALVRLRVGKGYSSNRIGQINLSANPMLFKMFERDVDRDKLSMYFMDALQTVDDKVMEDAILRQEARLRPSLYMHKYELLKERGDYVGSLGKKAKNFLRNAAEAIGIEHLTAYFSQKTQAHFGYTIGRAVDRWIGTLAFGSAEELSSMAIKPEAQALANRFRAGMSADKMSAFNAVYQSIYQGGVQKGAKAPLLDLAESLVGMREKALEKGLTYEQITDEISSSVAEFIKHQTKRREFYSSPYLLRKAGAEDSSLRHILADLERGAVQNLKDSDISRLQSAVDLQASKLIGEVLGIGYAIQPGIGKIPTNVRSVLEDKARPGADLGKKVAAQIYGDTELEAGSISNLKKLIEKEKKAATESKSLVNIFEGLSANKKAIFVGAAAGLGVLAFGGLMSPSAPMPPAIDDSQPTDMGPAIAGGNSRLYGAKTLPANNIVPFAGSRGYSPVRRPSSNTSFTNVRVTDRTRTVHPYISEKQAYRQMNSDF